MAESTARRQWLKRAWVLTKQAAVSALVPDSQRRPARAQGQLGMTLTQQNLSLARTIHTPGGKPRLVACEFRVLPKQQDPALALRQIFLELQLQNMQVNHVLEPDEYQLLLVETPDVPETELREAVRWRVHELIDFPVAEAVIDVFDMPQHSSHIQGQSRTMGAVVCRNSVIAQKAALLNRSGADLDVIDAAELALRNIASLLDEDQNGVALLHLQFDQSLIQITCRSTLYLSRRIKVGYQELISAAASGNNSEESLRLLGVLSFEVMRSLEYYESRLSQPTVSAFYIAPTLTPVAGLAKTLGDDTGLPIQLLDLNRLLDAHGRINAEQQARCLLAIGGALRQEQIQL